MSLKVFSCQGGTLVMPPADLVLVDRLDGGNLVVNPPRDVWERGELSLDELQNWTCLVAAAGSAMLLTLPQLGDGCINYWEAGNWALNDAAPPTGSKTPRLHRSVHLHLLGRSKHARSSQMIWGEAPFFPRYSERKKWASDHQRLTPAEIHDVVATTKKILQQKYGFQSVDIYNSITCSGCGYPVVVNDTKSQCAECAT